MRDLNGQFNDVTPQTPAIIKRPVEGELVWFHIRQEIRLAEISNPEVGMTLCC